MQGSHSLLLGTSQPRERHTDSPRSLQDAADTILSPFDSISAEPQRALTRGPRGEQARRALRSVPGLGLPGPAAAAGVFRAALAALARIPPRPAASPLPEGAGGRCQATPSRSPADPHARRRRESQRSRGSRRRAPRSRRALPAPRGSPAGRARSRPSAPVRRGNGPGTTPGPGRAPRDYSSRHAFGPVARPLLPDSLWGAQRRACAVRGGGGGCGGGGAAAPVFAPGSGRVGTALRLRPLPGRACRGWGHGRREGGVGPAWLLPAVVSVLWPCRAGELSAPAGLRGGLGPECAA